MNEENEKELKPTSRKFIVWIVWGIVTLGIIAIALIKQTVSDSLIEKVLGYYFGISMMYLGVNVGQKAAISISDAIKGGNE